MSRRAQSSLPPLGRKVRQLREANGWTQESLADTAGVSLRTIQNLETKGQAALDTCTCLANVLGIEVAEFAALRAADRPTAEVPPAQEGVSQYLGRIRQMLESRVGPFVDLRVIGRQARITQSIENCILSGGSAVVLGGPGIGKSHAVLHAALRLCSHPVVPIFTRALLFTRTIDDLLQRAISPFSLLPFEDLLAAAAGTGAHVVLIIDGFNELSPSLQEMLANETQALQLRFRAIRLLITSQSAPPLASYDHMEKMEVAPCGIAERLAILEAHGLDMGRVDASGVIEAISSPFDLSLAAKCWSTLSSTPTRYQLIHSFLRMVFEQQDLGPSSFGLLCDLAEKMTSSLSYSSELPDVYRMLADAACRDGGDPYRLLRGPLLRTNGGRCVFAHELLLQFFAAEHLLRATKDLDALAHQLETPRSRALRGLAIEAQTSEDSIRRLLEKISVSNDLYSTIEAGAHGRMAQQVLRQEMNDVLLACGRSLLETTVEAIPSERDDGRTTLDTKIHCPWLPSDRQRDLLFFLGSAASPDEWFTPILNLLERLDAFVKTAASRASVAQGVPARSVERALYNAALHLVAGQAFPTGELIHGVANRSGFGQPSVHCLTGWFARAADLGPGTLQVLCSLGQRCALDKIAEEEVIGLLPKIVQVAWDRGSANTKLESLVLARAYAPRANDEQRTALLRVLHGLDSRDAFLNSYLLEAVEACGEDLEPASSPEYILNQIESILAKPDDSESQERASGIYRAQFELLEAVSRPNVEAVRSLEGAHLRRFLALAALGSSEDFPSDMAHCLETMVIAPGATEDQLVQRALERWAVVPPEQLVMPQDATSAFAHAHAGLGFLGFPGIEPSGMRTPRQAAWLGFGRLLHLAARQWRNGAVDRFQEKGEAHWRGLSTLLAESVEPFILLLDLAEWQRKPSSHLRTLAESWPRESGAHALEILETIDLQARRPLLWDRAGRLLTQTAILSDSPKVRSRLVALVDHPRLGHDALSAIHLLDGRSQ